jgi:hypothetical protein
MKKMFALSMVLGLFLNCCMPITAAPGTGGGPGQSQQQAYTDLTGAVTYSQGAADAGAHIYVLAGDAGQVTAANLDELTAKALRTADADEKGQWRISQVYAQSYEIVIVSAHVTGDARIFAAPLVMSGYGEREHRIDHQF